MRVLIGENNKEGDFNISCRTRSNPRQQHINRKRKRQFKLEVLYYYVTFAYAQYHRLYNCLEKFRHHAHFGRTYIYSWIHTCPFISDVHVHAHVHCILGEQEATLKIRQEIHPGGPGMKMWLQKIEWQNRIIEWILRMNWQEWYGFQRPKNVGKCVSLPSHPTVLIA